ncbi:hypothetical protein [Streptomyces sp. NPDC004135]
MPAPAATCIKHITATSRSPEHDGARAVGFGLGELDWGDSRQEQAAAAKFLLRVLDLALSRHRWDELPYVPSQAEEDLRTYRTMVQDFDPETTQIGTGVLPGPQEAAMASCVRHRVLSALAFWEACVFCTAED